MSKVYIMGILLSILLNNNAIMGVPVQNELELFLYTNLSTQSTISGGISFNKLITFVKSSSF